jgi:hypothetical protein
MTADIKINHHVIGIGRLFNMLARLLLCYSEKAQSFLRRLASGFHGLDSPSLHTHPPSEDF